MTRDLQNQKQTKRQEGFFELRNAVAIFTGPLYSFVWCQVIFQALFSLPWCIIVLFTIYHFLFTIYDIIQTKGFHKLHVLWKYNQKVNSFPVPHLLTQFLPLSSFPTFAKKEKETHTKIPPQNKTNKIPENFPAAKTALAMQRSWVQSLDREIDPTCCT